MCCDKLNDKKYTKANRRTMDFIHHMRRSAASAGRPGGLITEITWKAGKLEVICKWRDRQTILSKIVKSAIHVARLTIHEVDVRNGHDFSDKLVEDWRWQTR